MEGRTKSKLVTSSCPDLGEVRALSLLRVDDLWKPEASRSPPHLQLAARHKRAHITYCSGQYSYLRGNSPSSFAFNICQLKRPKALNLLR